MLRDTEPKPISGRFVIPTKKGLINLGIDQGSIFIGEEILETFRHEAKQIPIEARIELLRLEVENETVLRNKIALTLGAKKLRTAERIVVEDQEARLYFPLAALIPEQIPAVGEILRTIRSLYRGNVRLPAEIINLNDEEIMNIRNIGTRRLEIAKILKELARNSAQEDTTQENLDA